MKKLTILVVIAAFAGVAAAQDKPAAKPAEPAKPAAPPAAAKPADKPAAAAPAKPMEAPKPGPELDALKPMVKNWTCKGNGNLPAAGGGAPLAFSYTARVSSKWDLNGWWADWKYERAKTKEVPAFTGEGVWGYDQSAKKYNMFGSDSWGGWIDVASAGPSGDTFAFDGDIQVMGQKVPAKMTFTTDKDKKKLHFTLEAAGSKLVDDECK
jgi:hypothetical protein